MTAIIRVPVVAQVHALELVEWGVATTAFQVVETLQLPLLIDLAELMYLFKRRL